MPKQKINKSSKSLFSKLNLKNKKVLAVLLLLLLLLAAGIIMLCNRHTTDKTGSATTAKSGTKSTSSQPSSSAGTQSASSTASTSSTSKPTTTTSSGTSGSTTTSATSGSSSGQSGGSSGASTPAPPTVTGVTLTVDSSNVFVGCTESHNFVFTGTISADGPGTITYHWVQTDIGDSGPISLTFDAAGTKTVTKSWSFNGAETSYFAGNVTLGTLSPNSVLKSQPFTFTSNCN